MEHRIWSKILSPSTRAFTREARNTPGFSFFDWLHGYVYARWPYLYIGIGTGEHWIARRVGPIVGWLSRLFPANGSDNGSWADGYHGKVMPLQAATQLVTIQQDINLGDLEQIIPYARARDIILKHPDHIVALECPCRSARPEPCLPLDVCLLIGEPFASFVREHHPRRSRWIDSQEAVTILQAEHERGHVHHAFFKDAMLGRFYAICNCCACCCGAMHAHRNGTPMLAASGYVSQTRTPASDAACAPTIANLGHSRQRTTSPLWTPTLAWVAACASPSARKGPSCLYATRPTVSPLRCAN